MNNFKGELSQLDSISTSNLDLWTQLRLDPPSSAASAWRVTSMLSTLDSIRGALPHSPSESPTRPSSSSYTTSPTHYRRTRQNTSPLRTRSGPVESSLTYRNLSSSGSSSACALRVLHWSTASSSEPSLIPTVVAVDGARICKCYYEFPKSTSSPPT